MAKAKSAIKRNRQSKVRNERNRADRSIFRNALKRVEAAVADGNTETAQAELKTTLKIVGVTKRKGLIRAKKAARHSSRLTLKVAALAAGGVANDSE